MVSILVTGGAGFIGSHICEALLSQKHNVIALDNLTTGYAKNLQSFRNNLNFTFINGDVRNYELVRKIIKDYGVTSISHQAAFGSVPRSIEDPFLSNDINVNGTLNLLCASKELGIKRLTIAISSAIYGNSPVLPKKESMPYMVHSPYAATKVAKDIYARLFYELYGLETVGLRYFNIYGPRQDPNGSYAAAMPRFMLAALNNAPLEVFGDGKQTRDFTYVGDAVAANLLALTKKEAAGRSFNVCTGSSISINDLALLIIKLSGSKSKIIHSSSRKGDILHSFGALAYAKKYLGYSPKTPLEDGLKKTIAWFSS